MEELMVGPTQDGCVEGFLQSPDLVEGSESGRVHQAGVTERLSQRRGQVAQVRRRMRDSGVVVVVVVKKLCASRGPTGFSGGSWPSAAALHAWNHSGKVTLW